MKTKSHMRLRKGAFLLGLIILSACQKVQVFPSERDTVVFVLFDISGSTNSPQIRQSYLHDLDTIAQLLAQKGGTLRGDVIGSEALNTSTVPIDVVFPPYNVVLSTDKKHSDQIRTASDLLKHQSEQLLGGQKPATQTAIMSSLEIAAKILNGDQLKNAKRKILVIFSDMVEESPRYRFPREQFTQTRIQAIVEAERSSGRLPNLQGVKVWKAGASAVGLDDDHSRALQTFWIQYFRAAGADLEPDRYGSALLNFSIN